MPVSTVQRFDVIISNYQFNERVMIVCVFIRYILCFAFIPVCKSGRTYGPCGTIAGLQCDPGFTCVLESDVVSDSAGGCCKDGIYNLTMFLATSVLKCYEHNISVVLLN